MAITSGDDINVAQLGITVQSVREQNEKLPRFLRGDGLVRVVEITEVEPPEIIEDQSCHEILIHPGFSYPPVMKIGFKRVPDRILTILQQNYDQNKGRGNVKIYCMEGDQVYVFDPQSTGWDYVYMTKNALPRLNALVESPSGSSFRKRLHDLEQRIISAEELMREIQSFPEPNIPVDGMQFHIFGDVQRLKKPHFWSTRLDVVAHECYNYRPRNGFSAVYRESIPILAIDVKRE